MSVSNWHREIKDKQKKRVRLFNCYNNITSLKPKKITIELYVYPDTKTFNFKDLKYKLITQLYKLYKNRKAVSNALGISDKQVYIASRKDEKLQSNIKITIK